MGGISSVKDAIDFFRLGSKMIQIGTLNYKDPSISNRICNELKDFLVKYLVLFIKIVQKKLKSI